MIKKIFLNSNQNGFAGILALWLVVIIATILTTYTYIMLEDYRLMQTIQFGLQTEFNAVSGLNKAVDYLMTERQEPPNFNNLILNEIKISESGDGRYFEYIELYNPTMNPVDISNYKISIDIVNDSIIEIPLTSWNDLSQTNVVYADTISTILSPGHYGIILTPSFISDTGLHSYYNKMLPANASVFSLSGDTTGSKLGGLLLGGGLVIPDTWAKDVVISEVCIGNADGTVGTANEYIELYNPTANTINLTDWLIRRETQNGGDNPYITLSGSIEPFAYFIIGGSAYTGDMNNQRTSGGNMAASKNQIVLKNTSGNIVDAVGWGALDAGVAYFGSPTSDMHLTNFRVATRLLPTPSVDNSAEFDVHNSPNPKWGTYNVPPQPEDTTTVNIKLFVNPFNVLDEVFFDTSVGAVSYERVNFRDETGNINDDWVKLTATLPAGNFNILGTPGSLNLSVKFSDIIDDEDNLPYMSMAKDWWDYEEDFNNDGNIDFKWKLRPSLSKFNINHKLVLSNDDDEDIIIDDLRYYFALLGIANDNAQNVFYKTINTDYEKEFGNHFTLPNEFMLVSGVSEGRLKEYEDAVTIYPVNIGNFRLFPININSASDTTLYNYFRIITKDLNAAKNITNILRDVSVGLFDSYSNNDGDGALIKFIELLKSISATNTNWGDGAFASQYQGKIISNLITGNKGIPLIFGPTNIIGKYTYWELIVEGYNNWETGRPKNVKRIRADIAIPVYKNQPAPDNKARVIYWNEDWTTDYWRISEY